MKVEFNRAYVRMTPRNGVDCRFQVESEMPYLDAVIAFAITMLAVATIVAAIVRYIDSTLPKLPGILRAWLKGWIGDRIEIFGQMMDDFIKNELTHIIEREFHPEDPKGAAEQAINWVTGQLQSEEGLIHVENADLIDKLKQTDLGAKLLNIPNRAEEVFNEIARRYAAVEKVYSDKFRANTRWVTSIIALVIALALNIDSTSIAAAYLRNPALAATVAAKSDSVIAEYEANAEKLKGLPPQNPQDPAGKPPTDEQMQKDLKEVIDSGKAIQKKLEALNTSGFPFGWDFFPYGQNTTQFGAKFSSGLRWANWILGIGLTVVFAGLGAPFWYDVIRNLNNVARSSSATKSRPSS